MFVAAPSTELIGSSSYLPYHIPWYTAAELLGTVPFMVPAVRAYTIFRRLSLIFSVKLDPGQILSTSTGGVLGEFGPSAGLCPLWIPSLGSYFRSEMGLELLSFLSTT